MKTHARWTPDELALLQQVGDGKLLHELVELLPRHTPLGIRRKRTDLGINFSKDYFLRNAKYAWSKLDVNKLCKLDQSLTLDDVDENTLQILLGSILGDGSIKKNGRDNLRNFVFYEMHRRPQFQYTHWKLENLSLFRPTISESDEKNYSALQTCSHPIFTMMRDKFYKSRQKCGDKSKLPLDILKELDYLGLMIWYLDDGYRGVTKNAVKRTSYPYITAKGYDFQELTSLANILNNKLGLSLKVMPYRKKNRKGLDKRLMINADNTRKLFPVWQKMCIDLKLPKCMYYKLDMVK
jgi:hypothetical protein